MEKNKITLSESEFQNLIKEAVKNILSEKKNLKEDLEWDDNGYPINMPDDVCEWARKVQNLGYQLSLLKGKYRMTGGEYEELYNYLDSIDSAFNGVCADLNTFGMASHWSL